VLEALPITRGVAASMRRVAVSLAVTTAVVAGSAGIAAVPASAATNTAVYVCGQGGHWTCRSVRPGDITFGAHYAVERLSWSSWSSASAHGRGHYYGFGSYGANVTLYNVKIHSGRRYFSWIKIAASGHKARFLQYSGGQWHTR
jgi:hypothetical protein